MPIVAAPIDLVTIAKNDSNGLFNLAFPVWTFGGDLYTIGKHNTLPNDAIAIYKSTDGGNTWTIQDTGNEPTNASTCANYWDSVTGIVYVLVGPRSDQADVALRLYSFDCNANTWTLIDAGGPAAHWASGLWRLSTGDFVLAYGTDGANDLWLASYNGAWNNIQDLTLVSSLALRSYDVSGCLDSADFTHVFFHNTANNAYWHASVDAALALGTVDALDASINQIGQAIAIGASVIVAVGTATGLQVSTGTPLAAPVFSLSALIDAGAPGDIGLIYDTLTNSLAIVTSNSALEVYGLAQTNDLTGMAGWSVLATIYDEVLNPPPNDDFHGTFPAGLFGDGAGFIYLVSAYDNIAVNFTSFYIGSFQLAGSSPSVNPASLTMIQPQSLIQVALPRLTALDNTGASKNCFPLDKNKGCTKWA